MNITSESLIAQVNQYISEIISINMHLEKKDTRLPHLKLLQQKVRIKLTHFQTALDQLKYSQHSGATLKQIAQHLSNSFSQIVKEAHRLLQI
jgi:K+/H+ antiporter YhaU regulatory subunit KhtT